MTPFEFYEKGADLLRDASAKDAGAEYEAALALYKRGLTYLLTGKLTPVLPRVPVVAAAFSYVVFFCLRRFQPIWLDLVPSWFVW